MIAKNILKELHDMQKELEEVKKKINQIENDGKCTDIVKCSSKYFPYTEQNYKIKGLDIISNSQREKYINLLKNRYKKIIDNKIKITEFINEIPTSRLRRIFEYRYINQYSWIKIAHKIGGQATSESVRKEHDCYLKQK